MSQIPIFTIGYGAREMDELLAVLEEQAIAFLLDIRSRPYSRYKPEFSKDALSQHVERRGIRYVYVGDTLGGQPEEPDCYTDGKVDYAKVKARPFYQQGLDRLQKAYRQQQRVALMCSEGKPELCHRSKLIGRSLAALGIPVAHIDEKDQLISQEDVMLRLNKGQPSLFGEDFYQFTSRKRYQQEQDDD